MRELFDFDDSALKVKRSSLISNVTDNISAALTKRKEDEFRAVINEVLPPGWTMEDVKRRCSLVRYHGSPIETLCIDGKPVLVLYPVEFETVETDTGRTMRCTQKYRKLTV